MNNQQIKLKYKLNHLQAWLLLKEKIGIESLSQIDLIAHRLVYGGQRDFNGMTITTKKYQELVKFIDLAPMHQGPALKIVNWFQVHHKKILQVAYFDTSFFNQLPSEQKQLPVSSIIQKAGVIKRGFHGISHQNCFEQLCQQEKKKVQQVNMLSVHLGGGCSMAVIAGGKPLATSMSLTPNSGLIMMSRSGDIDSGIIFYLLKKGWSISKIQTELNENSGFKSHAGTANFENFLQQLKSNPNKQKISALTKFVDNIAFHINGYLSLWPETKYLVFTGGLGQNSAFLRKLILSKVIFSIKVAVVPAQEIDFIYRHCQQLKNV